MDEKMKNLLQNLQKRNISGFYCQNKDEALKEILNIIPDCAQIGLSGSVTLGQLDVAKHLIARGNNVIDQYKTGLTKEESLKLRRESINADYYLASANAITEDGELVFFSAYGNRTAGVSYAKNAVIICGANKIAKNLDQAVKRAREYATPLNCKRLNWVDAPCFRDGKCLKDICFASEYKRMCCQVLIIEAEVVPDRLKVILVGEDLGF